MSDHPFDRLGAAMPDAIAAVKAAVREQGMEPKAVVINVVATCPALSDPAMLFAAGSVVPRRPAAVRDMIGQSLAESASEVCDV